MKDDNTDIRVVGYAATQPGGPLQKTSYALPPVGKEDVDIRVSYCGVCYSDISMINNDWGSSVYPLVPGHEIVGEVVRTGSDVKGIKTGDKVGLGWFSQSCMHCPHCLRGDQHFCKEAEQTLVGRHGGFADHVRAHWSWVIPLPEKIDMAKAGPLLCGGITVFAPVFSRIKPTDKVGVIGIGGLGHMAIRFLHHWGCEVIAFSASRSKYEEIKSMGATAVIDSTDQSAIQTIKGQLDFILSTVNVPLEWNTYIDCLAPRGELHTVGVVPEPIQVPVFNLINGEKTISGSPSAGPGLIRTMLNFCVRHSIYPAVEEFPMEKVNEALQHLKDGKARYRIVLKNE